MALHFTVVGGTSADWTLIDEVRVTIPGSGSGGPATDIAFFGIDTDIVSSSLAVVPEPSATSFMLRAAVFGFIFMSRRNWAGHAVHQFSRKCRM